jgi:Fe2+ or Zn2+ uptake regulation protein
MRHDPQPDSRPGDRHATLSQVDLSASPRDLKRRSLVSELISRGIRMTPQRKLLVAIIQEASQHLDAATLLHLARKQDPGIDRATVYRTLGTLKRLGLIDELDLMHLEGEKHFYEAKTNRDHCHLACFRCGSIVEYTSEAFEALKKEITKRGGFEIGVIRLEAGGLCNKCRTSSVELREESKKKSARGKKGRRR